MFAIQIPNVVQWRLLWPPNTKLFVRYSSHDRNKKPFSNRTFLDDSNTELVLFKSRSDSNFILILLVFQTLTYWTFYVIFFSVFEGRTTFRSVRVLPTSKTNQFSEGKKSLVGNRLVQTHILRGLKYWTCLAKGSSSIIPWRCLGLAWPDCPLGRRNGFGYRFYSIGDFEMVLKWVCWKLYWYRFLLVVYWVLLIGWLLWFVLFLCIFWSGCHHP